MKNKKCERRRADRRRRTNEALTSRLGTVAREAKATVQYERFAADQQELAERHAHPHPGWL